MEENKIIRFHGSLKYFMGADRFFEMAVNTKVDSGRVTLEQALACFSRRDDSRRIMWCRNFLFLKIFFFFFEDTRGFLPLSESYTSLLCTARSP